jgi:hypothetical protein
VSRQLCHSFHSLFNIPWRLIDSVKSVTPKKAINTREPKLGHEQPPY